MYKSEARKGRGKKKKIVDVTLLLTFRKSKTSTSDPFQLPFFGTGSGRGVEALEPGSFYLFFFSLSLSQSFKYLSSTAKRRETTLPTPPLPSPPHWQRRETERGYN